MRVPCRTGHPDDWWPSTQLSGRMSVARLRRLNEQAARLCSGCPITPACARKALEVNPSDPSFWAGTFVFGTHYRAEACWPKAHTESLERLERIAGFERKSA